MGRLFERVDESQPSLTINIEGSTKSSLDTQDGISFKLNAPQEEPKKKTRKLSNKSTSISGVVTGTISEKSQKDEMLTTDKPYETKYAETTNMLKGAIVQLDALLGESLKDASDVRSSRTLKRKYDILPLLNNNASSIINNKIAAIREINSTISKCNDLELKRMKDLSFASTNENSDKKIMDLYNAFVTMPVGGVGDPMMGGNSFQNISNAISMGNVVTGSIIGGEDDAAYQQYVANMTPAQKLAMYESNPNVRQVVVYNQQTGSRYFEVMDMSTGEVIQGVDKHDNMFLEGVTLDLENKIARNIDLGETYPIVIVGEPVMNMY